LFSLLITSSVLAEVENWYFERTKYIDTTYIFISANQTTNVKCAIYDENDKPIRVSEGTVTPPLSEVLIISQGAVITSIQCWEQEPDIYEQLIEALLLQLTKSLEGLDTLEAEERVDKYLMELEKLAEQEARSLTQEIEAEERQESEVIVDNEFSKLKSSYIGLIAARIKDQWRYMGAGDGWGCDVYIIQDENGYVEAINVQDCTIDDSDKAESFRNSIERAVYKASPLPLAPDRSVFDTEIMFHFRIN